MKKIIILLIAVILAFTFTVCDDEQKQEQEPDSAPTIGSTGQGGGIIFFAEGGQYMECSGELGLDTWDGAKTRAQNFNGGGYEDWRLPDRAELDLINKNLFQTELVSFSYNGYWTSVQSSTTDAWYQYFSYNYGNNQYTGLKTNSFGVRAIRSYSDEPEPEPETTTLTIKNESSIEITDVIWNNVTFASGQTSIKTGTNMVKGVSAGSGYIYFKKVGHPIPIRTSALFTVNEDEKKEFVFTNNTLVCETDNTSNSETLSAFFIKPWIIIKQGNTIIKQYGTYNFGTVLFDTTKNVTFSIENIGGENLNLITVNDNRINIENNNDGYFKIIQQPLLPTIIPGNTSTFTIQFNPIEVGNYEASIHIKTNSQSNDEFAFIIRGTGRNYEIRDIGPSGGYIFYDKGIFSDGWRYLEAAPAETEFRAEWGAYNVNIENTGLSIGSGKRNTEIIITALLELEENNKAAQLCNDLEFEGFDDWFLPSRDELSLLKDNLHMYNLGGFNFSGGYWTSSQNNNTNAWFLCYRYLVNNYYYVSEGYNKSTICNVRAIRAF